MKVPYSQIKNTIRQDKYCSIICLQIQFNLSFPDASRYFALLQEDHVVSSARQEQGYPLLNPLDPESDEDRLVMASNDPELIKTRAFAYQNGKGMAYNDSKAFAFFRQGVYLGDHEATYVLAYYFLYGIGEKKNKEEGLRLLNRLAAKHDSRALCSLAKFSYEGTFLPLDRQKALAYLQETSPLCDYASDLLALAEQGRLPQKWPPLFAHPRVTMN